MKKLSAMLLLALTLVSWGCGDDSVENNGVAANNGECPAGQRWNPVLAKCDDESSTNNGGTNNGGTNNGATNNGGTNNGATNNGGTNNGATNNGGTNNGGTNNGGTNNGTVVEMCGPGSIIGKTCAPSGEPLAAADITLEGVDCDGNPFTLTTRADGSGEFSFDDVPAGTHNLKVSSGSFESERPVLVRNGQVTDLTTAADKVCIDQSVNIAVIGGAYDHVEGVLTALNLQHDIKGDDDPFGRYGETVAFLSDATAMGAYDIIFVNCGNLFGNMQSDFFVDQMAIYNNLRTFVQGGKSLYFSDLAHPLLENAFPEMVDFHGDDAMLQEAQMGYAPQTIVADVTSPGLQTLLGANTATIEFPHDPLANPPVLNNNWAVAAAAGAGVTAHLLGDAQLCQASNNPFNPCPAVDGVAMDAALLLTYKDPSGGSVVFTSFHNERQVALNQDMERILRFLIFQL